MRATAWEFKNRAMIFGLILGLGFSLFSIDHSSATAFAADWIAPKLHMEGDSVVRIIFFLGAALLSAAALLRTWASSYLAATVVYASQVKTESLVADGPYRHLRNPLYAANIWMAIALGTMMSLSGFLFTAIAMTIYCYRLILREEAELSVSQGQSYSRYCAAVPRLWPSIRARIPASGNQADWSTGLKAEFWYWGFAIALFTFAITLKLPFFFVAMTAAIALFWVSSALLAKKS